MLPLPVMDQIQIQNHVNTVEESFQQLATLKLEHYLEMAEIHEQLSKKLDQINTHMFELEKLKYFKITLDRLLTFLDLNKEGLKDCWPYLKDRFTIYEQEIINITRIKKQVPHGQLAQIINQFLKLNMESYDQVGPTFELDSNLNPIEDLGHAIETDQNENQDWRLAFNAEARQRAVKWIIDTLNGYLTARAGPDSLDQLHKSAVRFEERIFNSASSQAEYIRKISQKMSAAKEKAESINPEMQTQAQSLAQSQGMLHQTEMQISSCTTTAGDMPGLMQAQHNQLNPLQQFHTGRHIGDIADWLEPPQKKSKRDTSDATILTDNYNVTNILSDADIGVLSLTDGHDISDYQPWW